MKALYFCSVVLFLVYLPSSRAQPEVGIAPRYHEQNNPLLHTFGQGVRLLSLQPDAIELALFKKMEFHYHPQGQSNEIFVSKFLKWIYNYFLTGNYRDYQALPSIVQAPFKRPDETKQPQRPLERNIAKKIIRKHKKIAGSMPFRVAQNAVHRELITRAKVFDIPYKILNTDTMPPEFSSQWLWNIICDIQTAVLKYKDSGNYTNYFVDVLDRYDRGLATVAKPILQIIFSSKDTQLVDQHTRNMVSFWLDKIVCEHSELDWRQWLLSTADNPDTLLHSPSQCLTDLKSQNGNPLNPYRFSQAELEPVKRPEDHFSSITLWDISVEIDSSIDKGTPFTWPDDPVLTAAVLYILNEFAHSYSLLSSSEHYLMEYWLDRAVKKISEQDGDDEEILWKDRIESIPVDVNLLYFTTTPQLPPTLQKRRS